MKKLRVGVIGCGYMAQMAHIPCLAKHPMVELTALCGRRADVVGALAKRWEVPRSCGTVEELLTGDVDAVFVLTPVQWHLANISAALRAGKRVFTEKPAAMSAESARKLAALAAGEKIGATVGYMKRHDSNIRALKELVTEEKWGKLLFIRSHAFIGGHWNAAIDDVMPVIRSSEPAPAFDATELDPAPTFMTSPRDAKFYSFENPYFGLLDTGCHSINLLRYLAGKEPAVRSAVERSGVKTAEFDFNGVTGTMEFCVNFQMNRWDEVTELYFERASIRVLTPPPLDMQSSSVVEIYEESGSQFRNLTLGDNRQWAFRLQTEAFVEKALKGDHDSSDLEDAAKDIAVIEDIYKALEEKK